MLTNKPRICFFVNASLYAKYKLNVTNGIYIATLKEVIRPKLTPTSADDWMVKAIIIPAIAFKTIFQRFSFTFRRMFLNENTTHITPMIKINVDVISAEESEPVLNDFVK